MAHGYQMKLPTDAVTVDGVDVYHNGTKFVVGTNSASYEFSEEDWIALMKGMKAVWATWRSKHPDDKVDLEEKNRRPHPPVKDKG